MIAHYKTFKFYANDWDLDAIDQTIKDLGILILDRGAAIMHLPYEKEVFMASYECLASRDNYKKFKKFAKKGNFTIVIMD